MQHPAYRPLRSLVPLLLHPGPPLCHRAPPGPALCSASPCFLSTPPVLTLHPAHSAMSAELAYILDRIHLQEYLPNLVENGFDSVRALLLPSHRPCL